MAIDIEAPGAEEAALKAAIQALANEIVVVTLNANATLDSTYYSKLTVVGTAGVVITFPAAPATVQTLDILNSSAGSITVNGVSVVAGKTVGYVSVGSSWVQIAPNLATPSSIVGAHVMQPIPAGNYAFLAVNATATVNVTYVADRITFMPFLPARTYAYDRMDVEVGTAGAGGSTARMGIYSSNAAGVPDALLQEGVATIDTATTGNKNTALTPITLNAGTLYFLAMHTSGAPLFRALSSGATMPLNLTSNLAIINHITATQSYGALPGTAPAGTRALDSLPRIGLRVA